MMIKIKLKKIILTTLLLTNSYTTLADDNKFQVAIVKGEVGTSELSKGKVESGIKKLIASNIKQDFYANKMNLCVAYLQATSQQSDKTESACTEAITSLESMKHQSNKVRYLTALNYSNRGVARYRKNQITAALKDFEIAVEIDDNSITTGNLQKFNRLVSQEQVESITEFSD